MNKAFSSLPSTISKQDQWPARVVSPLVLLLFLTFAANTGRADLVKLNNGGELRGKIVSSGEGKQWIRLETLTGAVIVVERNQTQFVTMRSLVVEEYESRTRRVDEAWESHWDLSEWCRQHGLTKQREIHLRRVTELDPQHEKAQLALGRVWHQGSWVDRDQLMASQGYVKYKNKYITSQELEVIEKTADELQRERGWFQKIRLWHGWLDGSNSDRNRQAIAELKGLEDPNSATAIIKFLAADPRAEVRELSVAILVKISGNKAIFGLVKLALFDEASEVRTAAMAGIGQEYYQHAQSAFVQALRSEYNTVVCRAAVALGQIGDKNTIGPLIDALVTAHHYQVTTDVPANQTYSFNTDGSFASNSPPIPASVMAAVRTGQMLPPTIAPSNDVTPKKTVTIRVEHYNTDVLEALEKLTKQNFGYDKRTWGLWWAAEKNLGTKSAK